jgi:hypothetical protein
VRDTTATWAQDDGRRRLTSLLESLDESVMMCCPHVFGELTGLRPYSVGRRFRTFTQDSMPVVDMLAALGKVTPRPHT